MSGPLMQRWHDSDAWTGFVLVIVPIDRGGLAKAVEQAADLLAQNPVTAETVAIGYTLKDRDGAKDFKTAVIRSLRRTAIRTGHFFAPTVVFGVLVVGPGEDRIARAAALLMEAPDLEPFQLHVLTERATPEEFGSANVLRAVDALQEQHQRWPDASVPERLFVRPADPPPAPDPPAPPNSTRALPWDEPTPAAPRRKPEPEPDRAGGQLRVAWDSTVDKVRGLLPRPAPTPPETMDRLAGRHNDVELVYLVLAPDLTPPPRTVQHRRRDLLVEFDGALARTRGTTSTQVCVLAGDRKLVRNRAFRPAGELTARAVPKAGVGHFDLSVLVDDLTDVWYQDVESLRRRGTAITSTRVLLLSTHAPLADIDAVEHVEALSTGASVAWVLIDAEDGLMSEGFTEAGAQVFEDHADVVSAVLSAAFTEPGSGAAAADDQEDEREGHEEDRTSEPQRC